MLNILEDLYVGDEPLKIDESARPKYDGVLAVVEGPFGITETENRNKRVYTNEFWEKVLSREEVQQKLRERACLGEPEHPHTLFARLDRVSHIVTDAKVIPEKKMVWGRSEILDTPNGRILHTLFKAGVKVGISSRGAGSLEETKGKSLVKEKDYVFGGFDFVSEPSAQNAYPKIKEALVESLAPVVSELERHPDYYEGILEQWGVNLRLIREANEKYKVKVEEAERTTCSEASLRVKLEEKDRTITDLRAQVEGLLKQCKELSVKTSSLEEAQVAEEDVKKYRTLLAKFDSLVKVNEELRRRMVSLEEASKDSGKTLDEEKAKVQAEVAEIRRKMREELDATFEKAQAVNSKLEGDARKLREEIEEARGDQKRLQGILDDKVRKIEEFRRQLLEGASGAFGVDMAKLTEGLRPGFTPGDVLARVKALSPKLADSSLPLPVESSFIDKKVQLVDARVPKYDSRDMRPEPGVALKATLAKI